MQLKNSIQSAKILHLSLEDIQVLPVSGKDKLSEKDIVDLAASIRKNGLFEPVYVRRDIKDEKKYILVSGYHRFYAVSYLRAAAIPAVLLSMTDTEAALYTVIHNRFKHTLNRFEEAEILFRLLEGKRILPSALADYLGISPGALENKLSLLRLREKERAFLLSSGFSDFFVQELLLLPEDKRPPFIETIMTERWGEGEAIEHIHTLLLPKKPKVRLATISNDTVIFNSINRIVEGLQNSGIQAEIKKQEFDNRLEYTIVVENKPKQLSLELV